MDGSYTSATPPDPPRAGWGITATRGHIYDEYASDRGPLNYADQVELNGGTADINNFRADLLVALATISWAWDHVDTPRGGPCDGTGSTLLKSATPCGFYRRTGLTYILSGTTFAPTLADRIGCHVGMIALAKRELRWASLLSFPTFVPFLVTLVPRPADHSRPAGREA